MTDDAPPDLVEPGRDGGEREMLTSFLDYFRAVLVRKAWGLTDEELHRAVAPSPLTLGGLLFHMALVEDTWFGYQFLGQPELEPWASAPWDDDHDWEFHTAPDHAGNELVRRFEEATARSRTIQAGTSSLDQLSVRTRPADGQHWNLRWIMVHMIEEYARHCGHADYLREAIDGQTGD